MKKDAFIGWIVIIVILGGVGASMILSPAPAPAPGAAGGSALLGGSYVEHAAYYDIAANYASSTPLLAKVGPNADAAAVALMKQFVSATIDQFKTDGNFAHLTAADIHTLGLDAGRKETLQVMYLIASSPHTVSYVFTIYEDTLGAHGNTLFKTFTFDTTSGAVLALGDLFTPGSDYLGTLSTIARAELPSLIGNGANADMIKNGTQPEAQSFANFFIDNQDLVILFAPYQVAPYAAGPQTLRIPLARLGSIVKAAYR
jgi:hypothetical protein